MQNRAVRIIGAVCIALVVFLIINAVLNASSNFKPQNIEDIKAEGIKSDAYISDEKIRLLSFNTGYGALGDEESLKAEGGQGKRASSENIIKNLRGILEIVNLSNADVVLLQSVDTDSYRSRYIDELSFYTQEERFNSAFAIDYKCRSTSLLFPNRRVESGNLTLSKSSILMAKRVSLPNFKNGASNPRRCLLVTEFGVKDSEKKLYVINFQLDKYLTAEQIKEQTHAAFSYAELCYQNGDYVILGGSFNRSFEYTQERYPLSDRNRWNPDILSTGEVLSGWNLAYDPAVATARILSSGFDNDSEEKQVYVSDGFLVSPNLEVSMVVTVDQEFRYSSNNPVLLEVKPKKDIVK